MVWASLWSVAGLTFYRQIVSLLYTCFFLLKLPPRARPGLVNYIPAICLECVQFLTRPTLILKIQSAELVSRKQFQCVRILEMQMVQIQVWWNSFFGENPTSKSQTSPWSHNSAGASWRHCIHEPLQATRHATRMWYVACCPLNLKTFQSALTASIPDACSTWGAACTPSACTPWGCSDSATSSSKSSTRILKSCNCLSRRRFGKGTSTAEFWRHSSKLASGCKKNQDVKIFGKLEMQTHLGKVCGWQRFVFPAWKAAGDPRISERFQSLWLGVCDPRCWLRRCSLWNVPSKYVSKVSARTLFAPSLNLTLASTWPFKSAIVSLMELWIWAFLMILSCQKWSFVALVTASSAVREHLTSNRGRRGDSRKVVPCK